MAMETDVPNPYEGLSPEDKKRWIIIYPAYINAKKTQAEGRRIPKEKAVDVPTILEIRDVCISKGMNVELEASKHYPRELSRDNHHAGRVRVQVFKSDGSPFIAEIDSRRKLLVSLCELIPKLKSRQVKSSAEGGASGGGGGGKKKRKKR